MNRPPFLLPLVPLPSRTPRIGGSTRRIMRVRQ